VGPLLVASQIVLSLQLPRDLAADPLHQQLPADGRLRQPLALKLAAWAIFVLVSLANGALLMQLA
jgi:Mn2+/Fe2+ NRAMP family transporter